MARPKCPRRVEGQPASNYYKPRGIPLSQLEEQVIEIDELEALRLADANGEYHAQAAAKMNVSRQTFGRIVASARRKVADALVNGKALRITGSAWAVNAKREFRCNECGHAWEMDFGTGRPEGCPSCGSRDFHRDGEGSDTRP